MINLETDRNKFFKSYLTKNYSIKSKNEIINDLGLLNYTHNWI